MIKRLLLIIGLSCFFFYPLQAIAQNSALNSTEIIDSRLQQAVLDNKITLDEDQKAILAGKCPDAQNLLSEILRGTDQLIEQRIMAYSGIQKELQAIKLRMIRQGADASESDLLTGKIQQAMDKFSDQATVYKIALNDVVSVDCQQKPEQFEAGLIVMRAQRAKLLNESLKLKAIMSNADTDIFTQLKRRLTI